MDDNLERFRAAQQHDYERALREIRGGRKVSHWMWYIFPQMRGLGHSEMADYYGISGLDEARAYLDDPVLGPRLKEICEALLALEDQNAARVFGFPDDLKLRSSMTLFDAASGEAENVFSRVLTAYFQGEKDQKTLRLVGRA